MLAGASVPGWDTSHVSLWPDAGPGCPLAMAFFLVWSSYVRCALHGGISFATRGGSPSVRRSSISGFKTVPRQSCPAPASMRPSCCLMLFRLGGRKHCMPITTTSRFPSGKLSGNQPRELLIHCYRMLVPWRTPKTRCRKLCFAPGGIATALRKARRSVHGSTSWLRTPASKVCLWCGSQHRPKHFNEGTYTVVTDRDSDLRDRFPLCQHLKGSKQPRLLSPTAK